ncbi:uncharacterized protein LOC134185613 isoform X2 [Corticium candelabrum]|uniref:uncharacterized protein LOC134185613 isoform X2 n=1 Tax=Corticium candelabrum TaxID=121492 RepID=UPI002E25901C|nr:uncharacterized protein LOC134185613 isoform X2 [Corticium candelabrum]
MAAAGPPVEDSDEFDETYVLVELNGLFDVQASVSEAQLLKIWGIESDEQVLQLDDKFFKGQVTDVVGTNIFLETKQRKHSAKSIGNSSKTSKSQAHLQYHCHSTKMLSMDRVFLEPKQSTVEADGIADRDAVQQSIDLTGELSSDLHTQTADIVMDDQQ